MTLWQRFKSLFYESSQAATQQKPTRRSAGMELPVAGRSSVESTLGTHMGAALNFWAGVSPVIDFEMLCLLKQLWIFNPDMSQFVAHIVEMANTGHKLTVDSSSKRRSEQAVARLNESAARLYKNGAGIDGLLNQYLAQIAWSGALSSEDAINLPKGQVDKVVIVPVEQIRFRYIDGEYVAHQQPGVGAGLTRSPLGLIELNPETYAYYALLTVENSPYAKPPATAAVAAITGPQTDILENLQRVAKKFGLLGVISIAVEKPTQEEDESNAEYNARAGKYLQAVGAAAEKINNKGLIVTFSDQKVEHSSVTSDAKGFYDLHRTNEEQVFSGMNSIPAFHGRTDSSTETYADVVYNFMVAQAGNVQRLVKRRQERTYRLDLKLGGLPFDGVTLAFNRAHARNPLAQAQADNMRVSTAILKAQKGVITPDEAAQEMGYESAADPDLMLNNKPAADALNAVKGQRSQRVEENRIRLRFDRDSQSYKFIPQTITLASQNGVSASV